MASRKMRAKRRQERMQQLQRNTAMPPAQESIEELKATNPLEAQQTLLPDEREIIPAKEVEQRIECVPLERIVTEQYQRILNMKNVAGIVKNFDPAKLGVLVVSHRADGTYAVLDGQHRLTALRRLGYDAANCIVLEGMTIRQEADYFRRQNENKQSLRINDTFNASLWAEDAESLRIKELMDQYGFRHGKSGQPMCICAIGALQRILRRPADDGVSVSQLFHGKQAAQQQGAADAAPAVAGKNRRRAEEIRRCHIVTCKADHRPVFNRQPAVHRQVGESAGGFRGKVGEIFPHKTDHAVAVRR